MRYKLYFNCIFIFLILHSCKETDNDAIKEIKNVNSMKEEKSFFVTDASNIRHEVFSIKPEVFERMKIEGKLSFCDSIFNEYELNAYCLEDGKVILQESSRYALYPSLKVLSDVLSGYTGPYTKEFLDGKNPYGKDFPLQVDNIINKLLTDLSVSPDMSKTDVLQKLDSIIVKNRGDAFLDKYLLGFVAIIGNSIIEDFGGKWEMVLADDRRTWNPGIIINNQKIYFVNYILEDFLDYELRNPATEVFETVSDIIRYNIIKGPFSNLK